MKLDDFADQVFAVSIAIQAEFRANPFLKSLAQPEDLRGVQAAVQKVASSLILCADVNEAITRLKQDQSAALAALRLTILATDQHSSLAIERAYAATPHEPTVLPLHAFCSYLIELSDMLENAPPNPET